MEDFNNKVWDRYQELRTGFKGLKRNYQILLFIQLIEAFIGGWFYWQYFR